MWETYAHNKPIERNGCKFKELILEYDEYKWNKLTGLWFNEIGLVGNS